MPVWYHKRQNLTALASEWSKSSLVARLIVLKVFSEFPCSLFPLTSLIPAFSAASDLSTVCIGLYVSILRFYFHTCHFHMQLDAPSDWRPGGRGFNPRRGRQHSFVEIDHEIFSTVILSLPLIQEGQLSVSGERMCTILVNRLED